MDGYKYLGGGMMDASSLLPYPRNGGEPTRWSRLKSSYEFHFDGFSNFSPLVEVLVRIQDVDPRI